MDYQDQRRGTQALLDFGSRCILHLPEQSDWQIGSGDLVVGHSYQDDRALEPIAGNPPSALRGPAHT